MSDGPTYTQILATTEGPRVVELAARLGGGHDAELCRAALGVDLNGLALAAALGAEIPPAALTPVARAGGACVRFLVPPAGLLREVSGVEEARALARHRARDRVPEARAACSGRCGGAPTGAGPCSPSAAAATRRSSVRPPPPS